MLWYQISIARIFQSFVFNYSRFPVRLLLLFSFSGLFRICINQMNAFFFFKSIYVVITNFPLQLISATPKPILQPCGILSISWYALGGLTTTN